MTYCAYTKVHVLEPLTAPEVEITDVSYSTLTARWGNLNIHADGWVVVLKTEDGEIKEVKRKFDIRSLKHFSNFCYLFLGKLSAADSDSYF